MSRRSVSLAFVSGVRLLTFVSTDTAWAQKTVTCESDGGYKYCRADTYGKAVMVSEKSNGVCVGGTTWAYDRKGVWVDKGCRAEFELNEAWPGGKPGGMQRPNPEANAKVPKWAIGTFKGTIADWDNAPLTMSIAADGIATLTTPEGDVFGYYNDGMVRVPGPGSMTFEVKKTASGVQAISLTNRDHRILAMARQSN